MTTEQALTYIAVRDRALRQALEAELEQGWPPPFDWAAWRRTRATVVTKLQSSREWHRPRLHLVYGDASVEPERRAA
jgi:hypothetical protein